MFPIKYELEFEVYRFIGIPWQTDIQDPKTLKIAQKHLKRIVAQGILPKEGRFLIEVETRFFGVFTNYKVHTILN